MRFEFATAARIIFGPGVLNEVGPLAPTYGKQALLVSGGHPERAQPLVDLLQLNGVTVTTFSIRDEPSVELVQQGVEKAQQAQCDLVIAIGGGSVLDAGKAIAALATNPGEVMNYLEIIGRHQPITIAPLPFIAIPTTAGTGSEVTRNAVLSSAQHKLKVSLRSPLMLAKVAIVDPQLTHTAPREVTAASGIDALTQLIEPFVTPAANPLSDALCREGIGRAARSLRRAYNDGADAEAREDMALASLMGGLALANARLGAVHGFAGPFGGMFAAPHGAVCGRLLPNVMATNVRALKSREPQNPALARYTEVARLLTGSADASAEDGVAWVRALVGELSLPSLSRYGFSQADVAALVGRAASASSMQGNPIRLVQDEMEDILLASL